MGKGAATTPNATANPTVKKTDRSHVIHKALFQPCNITVSTAGDFLKIGPLTTSLVP